MIFKPNPEQCEMCTRRHMDCTLLDFSAMTAIEEDGSTTVVRCEFYTWGSANSVQLSAGAELFRARQGAIGLENGQLADLLGVSRSSVQKWRSGAQHVPQYIWLALNWIATTRRTGRD